MTNYSSYRELEIWKKARELVKEIYVATNDFPGTEQFGLISQMRRSAVSIPSNIAEGLGRQFKKEAIQFLHIGRGSLYELETQLFIAFDLDYLKKDRADTLLSRVDECKKLLNGMIRYFENNQSLK